MARRWKKKLADENSDKFIKKDENGQEEFESSKIDYAQLIKALQQYDNEMLEKFFDQPQDEPPVSLSDKGRENLRDTLSQLIGDNRADLLIQNEQKQYQADKKSWQHEKRTRFVKRTVRWGSMAASIGIAIFVVNIFSNSTMAFRLPKVELISDKKDDYSKLGPKEDTDSDGKLFDNTENGISTQYVLTEIIEGFELSDKVITSSMCFYVYSNSNIESYYFTQELVEHNVGINTEEKDYCIIDSPFGDAYYFRYGSSQSLVWNYNGYTFSIEGNITKEQLLSLQKSVQKEDKK